MSDSFATPWTVACQASLSKGFPREEYYSGLPFPSPGDLSDPGIELESPALAGRFFTTKPPGKPRSEGGISKFDTSPGASIAVAQKPPQPCDYLLAKIYSWAC